MSREIHRVVAQPDDLHGFHRPNSIEKDVPSRSTALTDVMSEDPREDIVARLATSGIGSDDLQRLSDQATVLVSLADTPPLLRECNRSRSTSEEAPRARRTYRPARG